MRNLVIISLCYLAVGVNADGWRRVLPLIPIDGPSPFKPSHLNTGESIESPPLVDVHKPADVKAPTQPVGLPMEHPGIVGVQTTVPPPPGVPSLPPVIAVQTTVPPPPGVPSLPPVIAVQPTVPPPPGIPSLPPIIAVQPTVTPQPGNANQNQSNPAEVITSGQPVNINQPGSTAAAVQGTLTPEYIGTTRQGSPANAQGTTEEEVDLQSLPIFTYPDTSPNTGVVTPGQPQNIPTTGGQPITPPPVQSTSTKTIEEEIDLPIFTRHVEKVVSPLTPQYVGTTGQGSPANAQGTTEEKVDLQSLPIFTYPDTSPNTGVVTPGQPQNIPTTGGQPITPPPVQSTSTKTIEEEIDLPIFTRHVEKVVSPLTPQYVGTTGQGSPANVQGTTEEKVDLQSLPIFTYPDTSPNTGVVTPGQPQNIPTTGGQPITPPPVQSTSTKTIEEEIDLSIFTHHVEKVVSPLTPQYVGTTGQGTPPSAQGTTEEDIGLPIFTFPPETSPNQGILISGQPQIVQTTGGQPIGTGQPGATTAPSTPGVEPSRTPGLISLIGQGTHTAAVEVTTAGPVVSAIVGNGITTIGQSIDQGPHTATPAVVQQTTGHPIDLSNVPNRGNAIFVPSSAKQVGCLFPKDCYEFREPDDWCLLPPNSAYFDRGCFCDLAAKSCIIERNVGNVKQWTHCTPKSESKCLKLFHVPLRFRRV